MATNPRSPSASVRPSASPASSPATSSSANSAPSPSPDDDDILLELEDLVAASYQRLAASAERLNVVSDELAKPIEAIEIALKKLNLGIETSVQMAGDFDHNTAYYWERNLAYRKLGGGKWGLTIEYKSGDASAPEPDRDERWPFNEAPRAYRLEAVDQLIPLLEEMIKVADETTQKFQGKIDNTKQVAFAIAKAATALAQKK